MKPMCANCGNEVGLIRQRAEPVPPENNDPACDVVLCSNCGVILGVLLPYEDQWDLETLLDLQIPGEERRRRTLKNAR